MLPRSVQQAIAVFEEEGNDMIRIALGLSGRRIPHYV